MDVIDWLLASDPAISWQAMRDLADADPAKVAAERARVAHEGLGARLLARQDPDGTWHRSGDPGWIPTLFSLRLLRATGVDPAAPAVEAAMVRLADGFRWDAEFGSKPFFDGEVEPCINGGALAIGSYFGRPSASLAQLLLDGQLDDGGWNCDAPRSKRSSYHSTICVLEGLLAYERSAGPSPEIAAARRRGEDYLLERGLFRRRSTGEVAHPEFLTLWFPPGYHYDVLRALDHLRDAGAAPDPRVDEAVRLVESRRQPDGTWLLDGERLRGLDVATGETVGAPSPWNTLRALRVLRWYHAGRQLPAARPGRGRSEQDRQPIEHTATTPDPGSRFTVSHAKHSAFRRDGLRPFYEYRDLGIDAATSGRFHAQVIRPNPDSPGAAGPHRHALEFQIVYVLKGWVVFDYEGVGRVPLEAGDCVHQPSGIVHAEIERSDDLEMLEITAPARFETTAVEPE